MDQWCTVLRPTPGEPEKKSRDLRSMERSLFSSVVMDFAGVLNDSRKLFLKNKKLMFSVTIFPLFLNCVVYLLNIFSIKPVVMNLILEASLLPGTDPSTLEYAGLLLRVFADVRLLVESAYTFLVVYATVSLLFSVAIVRASALTHTGKNIKIKEFLILTITSWKQPLVTYFYIILFILGYMFLLLITLVPVLLFTHNPNYLRARAIIVWILFAFFESYLAIVWNLSIVVSILEGTYGIQALGKAARIAKGVKLNFFLVNLFVGVLSFGFGQGMGLTDGKYPFAVNITIGLVVVSCIFLVNMFRLVAYTVSYFHCKIIHGEDVELQENREYTKIPSELLIGDNLP